MNRIVRCLFPIVALGIALCAQAQLPQFTISAGTTAVPITMTSSGAYSVIVKENSATPALTYTVWIGPYLISGVTGISEGIGQAFTFTATSNSPFLNGQIIGWIQASSSGTFVAIPSGLSSQPTFTSSNLVGQLSASQLAAGTPANGNVPTYNSGLVSWAPGGGSGSGTVTSVTLAGTANELSASGTCSSTTAVSCTFSFPSGGVTLPGTTSGTFSGPLTGNVTGNASGSAAAFTGSLSGDVTGTQSATTVGKINGTSLAGLGTGILKNTTATGVPSIAVAADFPTLNQNTTGNAATATNLATYPTPCSGGQFSEGFTSGSPPTNNCATPSGGGTVTSFSAGNLSPLFSTSVGTATTTPALSFSLSSASQNAVLAGPSTGGTGAPNYRALVPADLTAAVTNGCTSTNAGVHCAVGPGQAYGTTNALLAAASFPVHTVVDLDDYNTYADTGTANGGAGGGTVSFPVDPATYNLNLTVHFHGGGTAYAVGWHKRNSGSVVESVGPKLTFVYDTTKAPRLADPSAPTVSATSTGCTSPSITTGYYNVAVTYTNTNDYDHTNLSPATNVDVTNSPGAQCLALTPPTSPGGSAAHYVIYVAPATSGAALTGPYTCQGCSGGNPSLQTFGGSTVYLNSLTATGPKAPDENTTASFFVEGNAYGGILTNVVVRGNITVDAQGTPGATPFVEDSCQEDCGYRGVTALNVDGQTAGENGHYFLFEGMHSGTGSGSGDSYDLFGLSSTCGTGAATCYPAQAASTGPFTPVTSHVYPSTDEYFPELSHYIVTGENDCAVLDAAGTANISFTCFVTTASPFNTGQTQLYLSGAHVESSGYSGTITPFNSGQVAAGCSPASACATMLDDFGVSVTLMNSYSTTASMPLVVHLEANSFGSVLVNTNPITATDVAVRAEDCVTGVYTSAAGKIVPTFQEDAVGHCTNPTGADNWTVTNLFGLPTVAPGTPVAGNMWIDSSGNLHFENSSTNNQVVTTSTDINASNTVVATSLSSPLPIAQGGSAQPTRVSMATGGNKTSTAVDGTTFVGIGSGWTVPDSGEVSIICTGAWQTNTSSDGINFAFGGTATVGNALLSLTIATGATTASQVATGATVGSSPTMIGVVTNTTNTALSFILAGNFEITGTGTGTLLPEFQAKTGGTATLARSTSCIESQ
jgi:hypothetical protein